MSETNTFIFVASENGVDRSYKVACNDEPFDLEILIWPDPVYLVPRNGRKWSEGYWSYIYNKETIESIVEKIFSSTTRKIKNECPLFICMPYSSEWRVCSIKSSDEDNHRSFEIQFVCDLPPQVMKRVYETRWPRPLAMLLGNPIWCVGSILALTLLLSSLGWYVEMRHLLEEKNLMKEWSNATQYHTFGKAIFAVGIAILACYGLLFPLEWLYKLIARRKFRKADIGGFD